MFYTEEDRRAGPADATARRGARPGARRAHRLAGPQGRHPVLGRRGDHRAPRRRGQPHRLRQGHPRPHRAARPREAPCGPARSGCGSWSARSPTTPSSRSTPRASSRPGTSAPNGSRATPPTRPSAAASRCSTPRRTGAPASRCELLTEARDTGRVEHTGWRVRKDGSRFWGDVVITALHDDDGNLTGYAKVTRDRTDLKALEDAQDAFYATFNHDFRTPVTAIKGFVDAIRDADDATHAPCSSTRSSPAPTACSAWSRDWSSSPPSGPATPRSSWPTSTWPRSRAARSHDLSGHFDPARVHVADAVALATRQRGRHAPGRDQPGHQRTEVLPARTRRCDIAFSRGRAGYLRMSVTDQGRGIDPARHRHRSSTSSSAAGWPRTTAAPGSAWPASASSCTSRRAPSRSRARSASARP